MRTPKQALVNSAFILASSLIALLIGNGLAYLWVQSKLDEQLKFASRAANFEKHRSYFDSLDTDLHHIRSYEDRRDDDPTHLFFTRYTRYAPQRKNILIQGDSWALAGDTAAENLLRQFARQEGVGLVNAGTSSYAPIMMSRQLAFLRRQFDVRPNIVVAIIDQTDIGDTLCRYDAYLRGDVDKDEIKASWGPLPQRMELNRNLLSENLALYKLVRHVWIRQRDYIQERGLFARGQGRWDCIAEPLREGISNSARKTFVATLEEYVNVAFRDGQVRKVYLVTHPHAKTLSGDYRGDVASLIDEFIASSPHRNMLCHINFGADFDTVYRAFGRGRVFLKDDKASHLTPEAYRDVYFPRILSAANKGNC